MTVRPAQSHELLSILLERHELTDRELEIVLGLARGHTTKEIADQLCISAHTVRDHIKTIFNKVGVNSRGELVGSYSPSTCSPTSTPADCTNGTLVP